MIWDLAAGIPVPVQSYLDFSMTPARDPSIEDYPLSEGSELGSSARPGFEAL